MTVLMSSWYYEKKDLKKAPSLMDGLDMERESRYRREGARFIINVGTKMGLRYDTMATGVVYFHRFYMFHSFRTFPRYVTACCCLFLAGKVEETPKKCKDIIKIAKTFLGDSQFAQFGDDPKEEVMTLERILLQTIKFDLQVDHPYGHLLKYAKCLKGDKVKLQNMVQMAWTFINDSLCTTLCLQWEPEVIAIALMYLAGKLSKFEVVDWMNRSPKHSHWWAMFVEGMSVELLEDICHQVLDLYSTPNINTPQDSPPATPPTKSTRKTSQPPSPIEVAVASPVQAVKPKEIPVGQPIPRLEPGELKRKVAQTDFSKESSDSKISRPAPILEGKAIPTITTTSNSSPKTGTSSQGSDTQASSPSTPAYMDKIKMSDDQQSMDTFRSKITTGQQPYSQNASFLSNPDSIPGKTVSAVNVGPPQSFPPAPPPANVSYAPQSSQYYAPIAKDTQHYVNIQQPPPPPPPQSYPQHPFPPLPPVPPSGPPPSLPHVPPPPPPQYPDSTYGAMPPAGAASSFSSQYPPPRPIMTNPPPPPAPLPHQPPPGLPPGSLHGLPPRGPPPPPPPSHLGHPRLGHDGTYTPRHGMDPFAPHQDSRGGRSLPERHMRPGPDFGRPQGHYEGDRAPPRFRGQRDDYDVPYHHEASYDYDDSYRPNLNIQNQYKPEFDSPGRPPMPMHQPPRHFPMEHQPLRRHERGGSQQGAPTGIAPVRITGSNS